MADMQSADVSKSDKAQRPAGFFAKRFLGLFGALGVFLFAIVHEPSEAWRDQVFGLDESTVFGLIMAVIILVCNEIWVRWIAQRLSGLIQYAVIIGFSAPIGFALGRQSDGFRFEVLDDLDSWLGALSAAELAGLALGGVFLLWAFFMLALLGPKARDAANLTKREQRQVGASLPIMFGEGVLLILLVAARQLDWAAPGVTHGVSLFLAGAAFLLSIWFSASVYAKLDELERNLVYRQTTVTFLVYFFVLAAWALAEAIGIAPGLDAFGAFLVLNLVYMAVATPWSLWHARDELKES